MSKAYGITIDGTVYDVYIDYSTLTRSFELKEGNNSGTSLTGREIRDIIGTGYTYELQFEPNPENRASYDSLYELLSQPTDCHTVVMPFGQKVLTYQAMIESGSDTFYGIHNGEKVWGGLSITFKCIEPQVM